MHAMCRFWDVAPHPTYGRWGTPAGTHEEVTQREQTRTYGRSGERVFQDQPVGGILGHGGGAFWAHDHCGSHASRESIGMLLFGLAFFLPGVWWYYASFRDKKTVREYLETLHRNGYHNPLVAAGDYEDSQGTRGVEPPRLIKPWWIFVVAGALALGDYFWVDRALVVWGFAGCFEV